MIALDLLKERFGDDQAIISAHMNKLLSVERVKNISDTNGLRKLTDIVKSQIRGLNSVGIEANNFGPLLIPVVFSKIPAEIKLIISRKLGKDVWNAEIILETLETELQAREKLSLIKNDNPEHEKSNYSGSSLYTNSKFNKTNCCVFCEKDDHKPQNCEIVSKIEDKKNI